MKVFVGMSGGVDSSVTAALLKEQGHDVTGVYMKNWSKDLPGMTCPWREDYEDAKRVAVQLDIPFLLYDFEDEYRKTVVDYMIDGYKKGLTPNPDIMCNQEIKFKLFFDTAIAGGADMIATGHYARVSSQADGGGVSIASLKRMVLHEDQPDASTAVLLAAKDINKDQSYFLYRVQQAALARSLMPIGDFASKQDVRKMAEKYKLATARKKDSQGICFVGQVGIKDFLLHELGPQEPGAIIDQNGATVGQHDGAIFYTIGQRQGLGIGGGLPFYVTSKDMSKNELYVTTNLDDEKLWKKDLRLSAVHWINDPPEPGKRYRARLRYRAPLVDCEVEELEAFETAENRIGLILAEPERAVTPGQSAVIYEGDRVVGGGIVI